MEYTAVVVSDDNRFSRMIALELEDIGINAVICREIKDLKNVVPDVGLVLADLDFCNDGILSEVVSFLNNKKLLNGDGNDRIRIIGWSYSENVSDLFDKHTCHTVFHRPFLMRDFREAILNGTDNASTPEHEKRIKMPMHSRTVSAGSEIRYLHKNDRLMLDEGRREVMYGGERIRLSENEYAVLKLLCENKGVPVSRENILNVLGTADGNMGDVYICHLRKKLDEHFGIRFIYTVRGRGYMVKDR